MSHTTVAVLGLGIIGSRAADCLTNAGFRVHTWNRTPKGRADSTPTALQAVAESTVVSLYLKDRAAVRAVVEEIRPALTAGHLLLNHSTIDLATTQWLGEIAAEVGCRVLDCPFTGSKVAAGNGALVYYAGGDATVLEEARPILEATSRAILPTGAFGTATVLKLTTNLISACTVQALAESLAITTAHGVPASALIEAVKENACGSMLSGMKLPTMATGDYETHFSLSNMAKDSDYVRELADTAGIKAPSIETVSRRMHELCDQGRGDLDYSALASAYQA